MCLCAFNLTRIPPIFLYIFYCSVLILVAIQCWPESCGRLPDIPCYAYNPDRKALLFANPDIIRNISSSSAAFFALWWHFFKWHTPLYAEEGGEPRGTSRRKRGCPFSRPFLKSHLWNSIQPRRSYAAEAAYSLSGADGICNYKVVNTTECRKNQTLCTPLSVVHREEFHPFPAESQVNPTRVSSVADVSLGWLNLQRKCSGRRYGQLLPSTTVVMGLWNTQIATLTEWKTPQQYLGQIALAFELFLDQGLVVFADATYAESIKRILADLKDKWITEGHIERARILFERVCVVPLDIASLPYYHLRSHVRGAASAALRDPRYMIDPWNPPYFVYDYHIVQMSKMALTYAAAIANPYNSKFIMWIDPPRPNWYPRDRREVRRFLDGDFLSKHTKPGAILMQRGPERTSPGPWARACQGGILASQTKYHPGIIGTLFGATPAAWVRAFPIWEAVGFSLLSLALLNDEQHQHTVAACWFPQYFHVVPYHYSCHPHFVCLPKIISDANAGEGVLDAESRPSPIDWNGYRYPLDISRLIPEEMISRAR